ncbi:MAG TPA: hypothetical protein VHL80_10375 [Polyangia bacterium]|nr:hypothetical protein [Polyangia bacterium]
MLEHRLGFAIAVAASFFMGAGCFTDPVNMAPTVRIDTPTTTDNGMTVPADPFFRGAQLTYTATAGDSDGDTVHLAWQVETGKVCPPGFDRPENWPKGTWVGEPQMVVRPQDTEAVFCVWVKADDGRVASVDARTGVPLDHPPVAHLDLVAPAGPGPFAPKTQFTLSAAGSTDEDGGDAAGFTYSWALQSSLCSTMGLVPCADHPSDDAFRCLTADTAGECQIEVTVTDPAGLPSTADTTLTIDRGTLPVAVIDLVSPTGLGPYKLGHQMRVSAAHATVGANPRYVWTLERPDGTKDTPPPCDGDSTGVTACFVPDVSGDYDVTLMVSDDAGTNTSAPVKLTVAPDQPPCLANTTPDFNLPETKPDMPDLPFAVNIVDDDLDPFPGVADIDWLVSVNQGDFVLVVPSWPTFSLNTRAYSPTDDVRVRVEIRDRDTMRSATEFATCDADTCSLPNLFDATCVQRATWKVLLQ